MMTRVAEIPRILHQTWRADAVPAPFQRCRDGWLAQHPSWEHRLYDDAACLVFVRSRGARWLDLYERLPTAIQRADLFRYLVVDAYGGVYADVDMACYRPIDALLAGASCALSIEAHLTRRRQHELGYTQPRQLANCIFSATPGHPFLQALIDEIASLVRLDVQTDADVEDSTGPRMLTRVFERLDPEEQAGIRVLPQMLLMAPRECPRVPLLGPPIHARHLFAGSWKRPSGRASLRRWWIERSRIPPLWPRLPGGADA